MDTIRLILIIVISHFLAQKTYSQCTIGNDRGNNKGFVNEDKYPFTTFYRSDNQGAFQYGRSVQESIDTFRNRLSSILSRYKQDNTLMQHRPAFDTYQNLHSLARKPNESYLIEGQVEPSYKRREAFS
ncbi:MAG: hypothetical protein KDC92_12995, partial [Bacteroidetes bacterium]|nr:hypothetical protein [Bacteroidota bacterium]